MPEWYFLPFYAILRAITFNIGPIDLEARRRAGDVRLDRWSCSSCRGWTRRRSSSAVYRPWYKLFFWLFAANAVFLGWLGAKPAEGVYTTLAQLSTAYYFGFFLIILPLLGLVETPKRRLPNSITEAVLEKNKARTTEAPVAAE